MKASKESVSYSLGEAKSHCGRGFEGDTGYCRYYRPGTEYEGTCVRVQGTIKSMYWCRLWSKAPSR
jgi:hypothetical protein